jgi:hypothetical protein
MLARRPALPASGALLGRAGAGHRARLGPSRRGALHPAARVQPIGRLAREPARLLPRRCGGGPFHLALRCRGGGAFHLTGLWGGGGGPLHVTGLRGRLLHPARLRYGPARLGGARGGAVHRAGLVHRLTPPLGVRRRASLGWSLGRPLDLWRALDPGHRLHLRRALGLGTAWLLWGAGRIRSP